MSVIRLDIVGRVTVDSGTIVVADPGSYRGKRVRRYLDENLGTILKDGVGLPDGEYGPIVTFTPGGDGNYPVCRAIDPETGACLGLMVWFGPDPSAPTNKEGTREGTNTVSGAGQSQDGDQGADRGRG